MLGESHKLPSIGNRNRNHFYNFILSKIQLSTIQARNTENIKLKAYSLVPPAPGWGLLVENKKSMLRWQAWTIFKVTNPLSTPNELILGNL